jgi:hypothetical protein
MRMAFHCELLVRLSDFYRERRPGHCGIVAISRFMMLFVSFGF